MQLVDLELHNLGEEKSIMKNICKKYVPVDRSSVQRRITRLEEVNCFLRNRSPNLNEIKDCTPYLNKQIELIKPQIIAPLGNFACSYIFEKFGLKHDKISSLHGKTFKIDTVFGEISIIPMYHPAVAVYNLNTKSTLIKDFKAITEVI